MAWSFTQKTYDYLQSQNVDAYWLNGAVLTLVTGAQSKNASTNYVLQCKAGYTFDNTATLSPVMGAATSTGNPFTVQVLMDSSYLKTQYFVPADNIIDTDIVQFQVAVKSIPQALSWDGNQPTTVVEGSTAVFKYKNGTAPYHIVVLEPDGTTEHDNLTTNDLLYNFVAEKGLPIGNYTVKVTDAGNATIPASTIQSVIAVTALPAQYIFTQADVNKISTEKFTMTVRGNPVVVGTKVYKGDAMTIQIIAGSGREFYFNAGSGGGSSVNFQDLSQTVNFTLSSDNQTGTATMKEVVDAGFPWVFNADTRVADRVVGGNNVYLVDDKIMERVNMQRFVTDPETSELVDFGQYILGYIQLPFNIASDWVIEKEGIQLATKTLSQQAPKIVTDVIALDLGVINVPAENGNLLDYANTKCVLRMPYIEEIEIDPEYVIGQTVGIVYEISMYDGKATVNVSSTKTNNTVISKKVDMGIKIPYANLLSPNVENGNISIVGDNNIKRPFIEIQRNDALLVEGEFTAVIIDEKILNTQTGFIKVDEIELNTKALHDERDDIISLLKRGVIIK